MTTMNTQNTTFSFRTKFEKLLTEENTPVITGAFAKFCSFTQENAFKTLWSLTYDNDVATGALNSLGLNPEIIPSENISVFRNELRHHFEKLHPDFLKVEVPEECREAFEALSNHSDPIVTAIVFEHCTASTLYESEESMNRILFLLNSDKENLFYGGIRALRFYEHESAYLKPFHQQIHDLLNALFEHHKERTVSKNTPFANLGTLISEAGIELPFDVKASDEPKANDSVEKQPDEPPTEKPVEEPVQIGSQFKPLTPEEVLAHKDLFDSFVKNNDLNILFKIGQLGHDLNQVMTKKEKIIDLLKAAEAFSN